jgi:acyltransferase
MSAADKRNLYIDIAKGIGIILVVFAHNMQLYSVRSYLFPFAVHFFFFMAGYNFNLYKYSMDPVNFIRTRVLRLMLPYLAACICSYFIYEVTAPILSLPQINVASALDGMMTGYLPDLEFNIVLWFLPALFFVDIIFLALGYKLKGVYFFAAIMLVTIAGFILGKYDQQLILSFDIAMTVQFFVYSGYMLRQSNLLEKTMQAAGKGFLKFILTTSIFLLLVAMIVYNANQVVPDIPTRAYGNPLLFFSAGLSGSIVVLMLSFVIATVIHSYVGRTLAVIGRASLDILISHIPIFLFFASVCAMLWGLWIHETYKNYWYLILLSGVAVPTLTHSLIAFILNKTITPKNLFY